MSGPRRIPTIIICLINLLFAIPSYAGEEIEDLIDITETNDKIIAVIEGKKTISFELRSKENVLWSGSKGYMGVFLTNQNFYVISTSLSSWQVLPLRIGESEKSAAHLSPYIALLVTEDRAVAFYALSDRFTEIQLPIHDELIAADAEKYVAVVITSSRAFGLAVETMVFSEIQFRVRESIKDIKITSSKATVRTSDRLLSFEAEGATWNEYRLD